jgi:hypothetical protein
VYRKEDRQLCQNFTAAASASPADREWLHDVLERWRTSDVPAQKEFY